MESINHPAAHHVPWNKGKLVGQKAPLKQREIWAIRIRLQLQREVRELALFNLAIDSKLRSCDLVRLRVRDVCQGGRVASRAIVMQRKTQRPVQFEITEQTRESLSSWMRSAELRPDDHVFSSRLRESPHLSTRQYARIVHRWVQASGLNPAAYGTHTMRRTKAALIYRRTKNLRVVQPAGRRPKSTVADRPGAVIPLGLMVFPRAVIHTTRHATVARHWNPIGTRAPHLRVEDRSQVASLRFAHNSTLRIFPGVAVSRTGPGEARHP